MEGHHADSLVMSYYIAFNINYSALWHSRISVELNSSVAYIRESGTETYTVISSTL